jgi:hypothetical protein
MNSILPLALRASCPSGAPATPSRPFHPSPGPTRPRRSTTSFTGWWRFALPVFAIAGALAVLYARPPIGQDQAYYQFADQRAVVGWPNFGDVASNLPFLLVGLAGLTALRRHNHARPSAWGTFFGGVALVAFGSAWFHWAPSDATLVWDRFPMTVAFTSLLVALLGEAVSPRGARFALAPALLLASATVLYWRWADDLRPYFAVQFVSLLGVAGIAALGKLPAGWRRRWIWLGLGCYALAFAAEQLDHRIYAATGHLFSGHTLKHLLAAAGCGSLLCLLRGHSDEDEPHRRSIASLPAAEEPVVQS